MAVSLRTASLAKIMPYLTACGDVLIIYGTGLFFHAAWPLSALLAIAGMGLLTTMAAYKRENLVTPRRQLAPLIVTALMLCVGSCLMLGLRQSGFLSAGILLLLCAWRWIIFSLTHPWQQVMMPRFVILGAGPKALQLHQHINSHPAFAAIYKGLYSPYSRTQWMMKQGDGGWNALIATLHSQGVEEIFWLPSGYSPQETAMAEKLKNYAVTLYQLDSTRMVSTREDLYHSSRCLYAHPLSYAQEVIKDVTDRTGALILSVALSPLLLITALLVRLSSPGSILFFQERGGLNKRIFTLVKFRTMCVEAGLDKTAPQAVKNDKRITPIGAWLRTSSLDELPQLWNVLRGDMSLIGARPHPLAHDERYAALLPDYAKRLRMKPGLSGWAQVNGALGYVESTDAMLKRLSYDNAYIEAWSLLKDMRIACQTLWLIFHRAIVR